MISKKVQFEKLPVVFAGNDKKEFEDTIKTFCLLWERAGGDVSKVLYIGHWLEELSSAAHALRRAFDSFSDSGPRAALGLGGWELFGSPSSKTYEAIYDEPSGQFRQNDVLKILQIDGKDLRDPMGRAKRSSADEGTTHLDPSMSVEEFTAAIRKGGKKTVDLDDFEGIKELTRKAKESARRPSRH